MTISNSNPEFDAPNTLELDFSDFNVDTDEIAETQRTFEFPYLNKTG